MKKLGISRPLLNSGINPLGEIQEGEESWQPAGEWNRVR
jgi:hypothetical protein